MDDSGKHQANSSGEIPAIGRRPGRPKGLPKPPGSGRQPGTPNRCTADVKAVAQKYSAKAVATLVKLLNNPDPRVQATAARELLDRAHGKPMQAMEHSGPNGAAIPTEEMSPRELARGIAFALAKGVKDAEKVGQTIAPVLELTPADLAPPAPKAVTPWHSGQTEYTPPPLDHAAIGAERERRRLTDRMMGGGTIHQVITSRRPR